MKINDLRTQCNKSGISCRDTNGNYLPAKDLRQLLKTQIGGVKPAPLNVIIPVQQFITSVGYSPHVIHNPNELVSAAITEYGMNPANFDTNIQPSAGIGVGIHGLNMIDVYFNGHLEFPQWQALSHAIDDAFPVPIPGPEPGLEPMLIPQIPMFARHRQDH